MTIEVLDLPEVAATLGMTKSAVHKAITRGTLEATLVTIPTGSKYVVARPEVERYRTAHRTPRLADR